MTLEVWLALCLASVALAPVPRPTATMIVANSLRYGGPDGHGAAFSGKAVS